MEKMSFNINFHSTLVDSETKNNLVCLFVGVANFPYYGKIEIYIRLHILNIGKIKIHDINSRKCIANELSYILHMFYVTWKYSKPSCQ